MAKPVTITPSVPQSWEASARIYDYRQAANPIRPGLTEPIPLKQWRPPALEPALSSIHPLDLSGSLGCDGPATSPALAAHYVLLHPEEPLCPEAAASSSLFYVLKGAGGLSFPGQSDPLPQSLEWAQGDLFVLPHGYSPELSAREASLLYWVHDGPLLRYLGVSPVEARFSPCFFSRERIDVELNRLMADPTAARSNRLSVLLAHGAMPATRTVSHTLWAMVGVVPGGAIQAPHRHQSVAIDLILEAAPGCHTLVGTELDGEGRIHRPKRIDWETGGVFLTPPGYWHSHVNPSGQPARLLPIQDAGLHTYLRSLDIRFAGGLTGQE
ncbi:MAG: cupin [Cyanobium sp.]